MQQTLKDMATSSPTPLIDLQQISIASGVHTLLDRVSLSVARNEIVTLIGPNGAGKSTLVKIALGLVRPDQGKVIKAKNLSIGYVPQTVNLDETLPLTVSRFLMLCHADVRNKTDRALQSVGAENLSQKSLHEISGGELRRVLLARALLSRPDLLILDEPTSGVDINGQAALYSLIQWIRDDFGCGILLVSHNLHIVMAATDKVVCLNRHLCCSGTPEDVQNHPEFVSLFGQQSASSLGVYRHHHDHDHDLHGTVRQHQNNSN